MGIYDLGFDARLDAELARREKEWEAQERLEQAFEDEHEDDFMLIANTINRLRDEAKRAGVYMRDASDCYHYGEWLIERERARKARMGETKKTTNT